MDEDSKLRKIIEEVPDEMKKRGEIAFDMFLLAQKQNTERITDDPACYITRKDGNYYFEGNLVYIKSKEAEYVIIFDVAYSLKPNGGKIEYEKIIEQCKKRGLENITAKSILRALTGKDANLFKYVKDIKQEPAYGISLFVAMQNGKEIEFNNKK